MRLLFLLSMSALLWGCFEQGECLDQTSDQVSLRFFNKSDLRERTVEIDSILVSGLPGARHKVSQLSSVTVPLDPLMSESTVTIYQPGAIAVITLTYTTQSTLLDPACGAAELFTLRGIQAQGIDSVRIVQSILSNVSTSEHVRLYF